MRLFNNKGMMLFPNPMKKSELHQSKSLLVIKKCYCPRGHNLVSNKAMFDTFKGILLKAHRGSQAGQLALSPVYGHKSRITLDLEVHSGEVWEISCPTCEEKLPVFSNCSCGGNLIALFLKPDANFSDR